MPPLLTLEFFLQMKHYPVRSAVDSVSRNQIKVPVLATFGLISNRDFKIFFSQAGHDTRQIQVEGYLE